MTLGFLVPAFLGGLLAIAIPVWVHLRRRRRTESVEFPSLMFLRRIPYRSVQEQHLRHRLLLALRIAAFALLALAFARPFLGDSVTGLPGARSARDVVVVLDTSWSMGYADRWQRAVAATRARLEDAVPGDRWSLVVFDEEARVVVESAGPGEVAAALETLAPSLGGTRISAGLAAAGGILAGGSLPAREAIVVSDFQRIGWDPRARVQLPEGTSIRPIAIGGEVDNVSVRSLQLQRRAGAAGEALVVVARLTRQGGSQPRRVPVRLEVAGQQPRETVVELAADGAAQATFAPLSVTGETVRGSVRIPPDALAGDDAYHFVLPAGGNLRVLLLQNPRGDGSDSFYLARALSFGTRPAFRVERRPLRGLAAGDLDGYDVVVLNDAGELAGEDLEGFAAAGRGVLIAAAEMTPPSSLEPLLPLALEAPVDRSMELGGTLAYLDTSHRALEVFARPGSGEFTRARFYTYRAVRPLPEEGVIARFDDGTPALLERPAGQGRALLYTTSLDTFWNDLPLQAVYLPFVHELVKYVAGYREPPIALPAGTPLAIGRLAGVLGADGLQPVGAALAGSAIEGSAETLTLPAGVHEILWRDANGGRHRQFVAANLDRRESDLASIDPEEVAAAVVWRQGGEVQGERDEVPAADRVEAAQSLWWYLLLLAAILLATEAVLSNRLSCRAS